MSWFDNAAIPNEDEDILFWTVRGQYLVIYRRDTSLLKIVRILHGARDVSSRL